MQKIILMIDDDLSVQKKVFPLVKQAAEKHGWIAKFWNPTLRKDEDEHEFFSMLVYYDTLGKFEDILTVESSLVRNLAKFQPGLILLDNYLAGQTAFGGLLTNMIHRAYPRAKVIASSNKRWETADGFFDKYNPTVEAVEIIIATYTKAEE
jgi:hypothetical protein